VENEPTNTSIAPTKATDASFRPNDIAFRLVLTPALGIVIPLITGMINPENLTHWEVKLSFLYTIGIAFVIWHGNRSLHFSLRSYFDWHRRPIRKIAALLLAIVFYTVPVTVLLLVGWYRIFEKGIVNWNVIFTSSLIIMICVIFITHVYETVFLVKESETEMLRSEQLERAKAEAELEALKNQIDPHFIFNSLNTLSHLIEEKPVKARLFNDNLADVYRYILTRKGKELVLMREELDFLSDYFSLLKIRFEHALTLQLNIDDGAPDEYLIPPISLQVLLENAVKHNEFSDQQPLVITITLEKEELVVSNPIHRKTLLRESSRIGLNNLNDRYRLTTNKSITIEEKEGNFEVRLPLLKIS